MTDFTYAQLVDIQLREFPDSIIITPAELAACYDNTQTEDIAWYRLMHPEAVYYVLARYPQRTYNTHEFHAGIRYGDYGDYCSLPPVQINREGECIAYFSYPEQAFIYKK